jgi:hypothetical protein
MAERVVNVTQFLNLHGPAFIEHAIEELDPWDARHQVALIRTPRAPMGHGDKEHEHGG